MSYETLENHDFVSVSPSLQDHLWRQEPYGIVKDISKNLVMVITHWPLEHNKIVSITPDDFCQLERANPSQSIDFIWKYQRFLWESTQWFWDREDLEHIRDIYQKCAQKTPPTVEDLIHMLSTQKAEYDEEYINTKKEMFTEINEIVELGDKSLEKIKKIFKF